MVDLTIVENQNTMWWYDCYCPMRIIHIINTFSYFIVHLSHIHYRFYIAASQQLNSSLVTLTSRPSHSSTPHITDNCPTTFHLSSAAWSHCRHCGYLHYCFISVIFTFSRILVLFISVLSRIRDFFMHFSSSHIYQYPQLNKTTIWVHLWD